MEQMCQLKCYLINFLTEKSCDSVTKKKQDTKIAYTSYI